MKKVYFSSYGGLYFCGKVRKNYAIGETFKLKSMRCPLKVINILEKELHVVSA